MAAKKGTAKYGRADCRYPKNIGTSFQCRHLADIDERSGAVQSYKLKHPASQQITHSDC